jgi:hypothetical protein
MAASSISVRFKVVDHVSEQHKKMEQVKARKSILTVPADVTLV